MNTYLILKHSHVLLVVLTFILFNIRYGLRLALPQKPLPRWLKIVPHINDTLLLLSGLGLMHITRWKPFGNAPWLGVKLVLLLLYIGWGVVAIKSTPRTGKSLFAYVMAMLCIMTMALLAVYKPVLW